VAELVASGEAEVGMQQIVAILPVNGAELVGPLPAGLQNVITYAAGISVARGTLRPRRSLRSPGPKRRNVLCIRWGWSQRDPKQSPAMGYGIARNRQKCLRHRAFMPISA